MHLFLKLWAHAAKQLLCTPPLVESWFQTLETPRSWSV